MQTGVLQPWVLPSIVTGLVIEGSAEAMKIMTDAESKRTELLAVVEAQAKAIRGEGDAEAAKYYK